MGHSKDDYKWSNTGPNTRTLANTEGAFMLLPLRARVMALTSGIVDIQDASTAGYFQLKSTVGSKRSKLQPVVWDETIRSGSVLVIDKFHGDNWELSVGSSSEGPCAVSVHVLVDTNLGQDAIVEYIVTYLL